MNDRTKKYTDYINSTAWTTKRKLFLLTQVCCYICKKPKSKGFHVHHVSYKNLGHEPFDDLRLLCEECHIGIHNLQKANSHISLLDNTERAAVNPKILEVGYVIKQQSSAKAKTKKEKRAARRAKRLKREEHNPAKSGSTKKPKTNSKIHVRPLPEPKWVNPPIRGPLPKIARTVGSLNEVENPVLKKRLEQHREVIVEETKAEEISRRKAVKKLKKLIIEARNLERMTAREKRHLKNLENIEKSRLQTSPIKWESTLKLSVSLETDKQNQQPQSDAPKL